MPGNSSIPSHGNPRRGPPTFATELLRKNASSTKSAALGALLCPPCPFLEHADSFLRATVAGALRYYVREVGVVEPALQHALAVEADPEVRDALEQALRGPA